MSNEARKLAREVARKRVDNQHRQQAAEQSRKAELTGEMSAAKREREEIQASAIAAHRRRQAIPTAAIWLALALGGIVLVQAFFLWRGWYRPAPVSHRAVAVVADAAITAAATTQVAELVAAWNEGGAPALAPCWAPTLPSWLRRAGEARLARAGRPLQVTVEQIQVESRTGMFLAYGRDVAGATLVFRLGRHQDQPVLLGIE